jgi:hypothetical protein
LDRSWTGSPVHRSTSFSYGPGWTTRETRELRKLQQRSITRTMNRDLKIINLRWDSYTPYGGGMNQAPDFSGTYPSQGELIGPAWQAAWIALAPGPLPSTRLVPIMCAASDIQPRTASELLRKARRSNKVTVKYRMIKKRRTAVYERTGGS